jgi:hypothetical protein
MNKETLEEAAESYVKDSSHELYQLRKQCFMDGAKSDAAKDYWYAKWQQERSYSEEEARSSLTDLSLVNPAHLTMTSDGYGEFPDSYKLTEKGINYIIEQFKKK